MLLKANGIQKQYGNKFVLTGIDFQLDEGNKVALVGANGIGKSTLIKILSGLEENDGGDIFLAKDKTLAYLPQEVIDPEEVAIDYITKDGIPAHKAFPVLSGLGLQQNLSERKMKELSGGQQTKVLLTKFLLDEADILLLDEPTNNLDIPSIIWLEEYLSASRKAMIIISHDLAFLNKVANRVFELTEDGLNVERGTYSDYIERQEKKYRRELEQYKQYMKEKARLQGNMKEMQGRGQEVDNYKPKENDKQILGSARDRATATQSRVKTIRKKLDQMDVHDKPIEKETFVIDIHPKTLEGDLNISLKDVVFGYKDGIRIGPVSFDIKLGERVCILGENGSGKSTLLKTIVKQIEQLEGDVLVTQGITFGDLMQQHERASRDKEVLELFISETRANSEKAFHMLKKAGLTEEVFNHKVGGLSSGTRARLLFAIFQALGVNTLILDEPTNHLDIEAVNAIISLLETYKGTVIMVTHNRWFLEKINIDVFYRVSDTGIEKISDFESFVKASEKEAEKRINLLKKKQI